MFKKVKKIAKKFIASMLTLAIILDSFPMLSRSFITQVSATTYTNFEENYAYLSDLWNTDYLIFKESSWKDARALKVNQNEPGDLISLLVDGKKTYFLNGVFAHATSTVIYDISEYQKNGYNTFSAYLGVDTYASSNGNGVKFTIYGSDDKDDKSKWVSLTSTNIMMGTTNALKVTLNITGYKYLILYADNNGNNASDHAVYADAMIYNSAKYTPTAPTEVEWIETVSKYDEQLLGKSSNEIVTNNNLRSTLLKRTLVSKVDYSILQAWVNSSSENLEVLEWLFADVDRLEQYLLGGTPTGGSYIKSLTILSEIYKKHKGDFEDTYVWRSTLQKLMFATSLTHTDTIASWFSGQGGAKVYSTALGRYEAIKELFIGAAENKNWAQKPNDNEVIPYVFEWEQFQDLTVEEMRWVTDNKLSDEEFLWLNWYATITKMGKTEYSKENAGDRRHINPYTYIEYGDGGNVGRDDYYVANPKCGVGNEFYNADKRTSDCYEKYHLKDWATLKTQTKSKPTLWIAFEEDGVCGTLMHVGQNLEKVFGIPSAGLGQPGHGAYIYENRVKNVDTGKYYTREWSTYNWVSNWDKSEKGERMLLDWGTRNRSTVFNSTYNLIYIPLAQKAINDYGKYRVSQLYMFMADVVTDAKGKADYYNLALKEIPYHITAWYNLLTLKVANNATPEELNTLGRDMMSKVGNAPTAIDELSNIIKNALGEQLDGYNIRRNTILEDLTKATDSEYMNADGVQAVAKSLLGKADYKAPASFSFDDNILRLEATYASRFEYALDYNNYSVNEKDKIKWIGVEGKSVDLTSKLSEIKADSDIAVHLIGDSADNVYIIDITQAATPNNLYANDLENRVIGATSTMEWKLASSNDKWIRFTDDTIFEGQKTILVRNRATGTTLASESIEFTFAEDPTADPTKKYIPISRLSANASSWQNNSEHPRSAIDGRPDTIWHNYWNGSDKDKWIEIEILDGPVEISKFDYVPRPNGGNGNYKKVKIETSLDGVNYDIIEESLEWKSDTSTKTYIFETPALAKYIRFTAVDSVGGFASASMINLYENTYAKIFSVDDLLVSYMNSGYVYNGEEKTPSIIVKNGKNELTPGVHYNLEYKDNINAGTGKIVITGLGIYKGQRELEFSIAKAEYPSVTPNKEMTATVEQSTLKLLGGLPEGWSWKNPDTKLSAGKTIEAIAEYEDKDNYVNYEFTVKVTRDIGHRPEIKGPTEKVEFDISNQANIKDLDYLLGLVEISDVEDDKEDLDIDISYDWKGNLDWTKEGTYHIYFVVTDTDGNVSEYTLEFVIIDKSAPRIKINDKDFVITIEDNLEYTGNEIIPTIKIVDSDGHELKEGADYELTFSENENAGIATVKISGIGVYTDEVSKKFTIKKASKPSVMPDSEITISSDTTSLNDISLPSGWRWENGNSEIVEGKNVFKLIYAGDENHEPYEIEIVVIKGEKVTEKDPNTDDKENDNKPGTSNGNNNNGNNNNSDNSNNNNNNGNNSNNTANNGNSSNANSNNSGSSNNTNNNSTNNGNNATKDETQSNDTVDSTDSDNEKDNSNKIDNNKNNASEEIKDSKKETFNFIDQWLDDEITLPEVFVAGIIMIAMAYLATILARRH